MCKKHQTNEASPKIIPIQMEYAGYTFDLTAECTSERSFRIKFPDALKKFMNPKAMGSGRIEEHNGRYYFDFGDDFFLPEFEKKIIELRKRHDDEFKELLTTA